MTWVIKCLQALTVSSSANSPFSKLSITSCNQLQIAKVHWVHSYLCWCQICRKIETLQSLMNFLNFGTSQVASLWTSQLLLTSQKYKRCALKLPKILLHIYMLSLSSSNGFKIPCNILQWNIIHAMWTWSPNDVSSIAASPLKRTKLKGMVGVLQYIYTKWFLAVEVSFVYICNFISKAPSETLDTIIHWFNHRQTVSRASLTRACHCMFLKFCSHETHCNIKRSTTSKIGKAIHGIQTLSMLSSSHGSTFKANTLTSFNCQAIIFSTFILEDQSDCFMKNGRLMIRREYLLIQYPEINEYCK